MFEDTSLWSKKVFKDLKYYKKTLRVLSYTNIIIKALLTLNDKTPKIFFHNNLPIRATKTGGFFYGSETEQFFKIASLPYFLALVEKVPQTFSIVSPPHRSNSLGDCLRLRI